MAGDRAEGFGMDVSCTAAFGNEPTPSYADWVEAKAHAWLRDHPAEAVAALIEAGVLTVHMYLCGNDFVVNADCVGAGHEPRPHIPLYRITGAGTDGR